MPLKCRLKPGNSRVVFLPCFGEEGLQAYERVLDSPDHWPVRDYTGIIFAKTSNARLTDPPWKDRAKSFWYGDGGSTSAEAVD